MPKIDQVLIDLVKEEAAKLREALKPEERARLNFDTLAFYDAENCVYGQAVGSCYTPRAATLIIKCAPRVYEGSNLSTKLNGKPTKGNMKLLDGLFSQFRDHHSPIEVFISYASKRCKKKLIQYLRKELDTLNL